VALWHPKHQVNLGTLLRSAHIFGAAFICTIGERYQRQSSDTIKTPRHTPLFHFADEADFWAHIPHDCAPVAVELAERAKSLVYFTHPQRAVYILGPEDGSLPDWFISGAHSVVEIPGRFCLNLAVAGSIVLYDRIAKESLRTETAARAKALTELVRPQHPHTERTA
jgi:tRNA(Leu) C34 or U34 (ribose-2'-O)-methylase TrmL